jgi:hypothetical protein
MTDSAVAGPQAARPPAGWLWRSFVGGWLFVLAVTGWLFAADPRTGARLPAVLLALALLAVLYLWLTLRRAIEPEDLASGRPGSAALGRRVALLGSMGAVVVALVLLAPHTGAWWLGMHVVVGAGLALPPALATRVNLFVVAPSTGCSSCSSPSPPVPSPSGSSRSTSPSSMPRARRSRARRWTASASASRATCTTSWATASRS